MNSNTCPIYKKFYSAMADTPNDIRHIVADSMCRQAAELNLSDSLSAKEIAAIISMKRQQREAQSKEEDPSGVPDKKMPISGYPDKKACIDGLVNDLNIDPARAEEECSTQFGPGKGTVSAKTKKAVLNNILQKYPSLSKQSANEIVNQTIREASMPKGSTRQAAIENEEIPYFVVASGADTSHLTDPVPKQSGHLKSASLDERKQYFDAINEPITDVLSNRAVRKDEQSKIKSASLKKKTDEDIPAWSRALDL